MMRPSVPNFCQFERKMVLFLQNCKQTCLKNAVCCCVVRQFVVILALTRSLPCTVRGVGGCCVWKRVAPGYMNSAPSSSTIGTVSNGEPVSRAERTPSVTTFIVGCMYVFFMLLSSVVILP